VEQDGDVGRIVVAADQYGGFRRQAVGRSAMRQEPRRWPCPHQPVEAGSQLSIRRVDQHALAVSYCFGGEPAGDLETVRGVEIEIYLRHLRPAWRSAKRTSNGTGRPVEPFSRPERQAVPAMSRCAQRCLRVKRARNEAAVILPPGRPPIFAMSAKFERSCSW